MIQVEQTTRVVILDPVTVCCWLCTWLKLTTSTPCQHLQDSGYVTYVHTSPYLTLHYLTLPSGRHPPS